MTEATHYFRQHWSGHQSLRHTWWLNCVLLSPVAVVISHIPGAFGWSDVANRPYWFVGGAVITILFYLAFCIWQLTGLWRAADRHMQHVGTILAGRAAQVGATIMMIGIALNLLGRTGQIGPLVPAALGRGPYELTLKTHAAGRQLEVRGGLGAGSAQQIERKILQLGGVRRLRLNLNAGSIEEANQLGRIILKYGLDTHVTEICTGVCSIAFEKGRRRYMQRSAKIGIFLPGLKNVWFPSNFELKSMEIVDIIYGQRQ